MINIITNFKIKGINELNNLTNNQLLSILELCDNNYHSSDDTLLTDSQYDIFREYIEKKIPNINLNVKVGSKPVKNKVTLPFEMPSMDKIKPDSNALSSWTKKYNGPYIVSCKLDGVSGLYSSSGKLYTRGDGTTGQDISYLLPYLNLPNCIDKDNKEVHVVVRGEFIMSKQTFKEKYSHTFANIRNLVSGIINRLDIDNKINDLDFICYEVIEPILTPENQLKLLNNMGFKTVHHIFKKELFNEDLSSILIDWREKYQYEIDGLIVGNNKIYNRISGNPLHSFAFKMVLSDQMAEAKVVDVIWTASKDGYLKPRVQIEPIILGGVTIEFCTGFNASFIRDNKIGIGAIIQLIRSGDVIPHIQSITCPASSGMLPYDIKYKWNESGVDILLEDLDSDNGVQEKVITLFFKGVGVDGIGQANISKIINAGFSTIPSIIKMNKNDFLKVEGFKEKMAEKIYNGIKSVLETTELIIIMASSNIFGRGLGEKKIEPIMNTYPDILISNYSKEEKIKMVTQVKGMAKKSAELFVENISQFLEFIDNCNLNYKLNLKITPKISIIHELTGKNIVMSGVRDDNIKQFLKEVDGYLLNSINKNTFCLITKTDGNETVKIAEAKKLGIKIMNIQEFTEKYII